MLDTQKLNEYRDWIDDKINSATRYDQLEHLVKLRLAVNDTIFGDSSTTSSYADVVNAKDLVKTFTYLNAGTADERVNTITYSSTLLDTIIVETISYEGSAGNYRVSGVTRVVN